VCLSAVRDEEIEAREAGVDIGVDISGDVPPALLDTVLVERAIANVVRNAVSVSKKGQCVFVRRDVLFEGPDGNQGSWARIAVKDEGPGIPPEIRAVLFNAFVTHGLDSSPKRVGIGLGLALAREIARAHGGDIVASDDTAKGAVFHIWIPLENTPALTEANGSTS
jgi:two-component system, NtrC family, sensor histidine kinase GlrK